VPPLARQVQDVVDGVAGRRGLSGAAPPIARHQVRQPEHGAQADHHKQGHQALRRRAASVHYDFLLDRHAGLPRHSLQPDCCRQPRPAPSWGSRRRCCGCACLPAHKLTAQDCSSGRINVRPRAGSGFAVQPHAGQQISNIRTPPTLYTYKRHMTKGVNIAGLKQTRTRPACCGASGVVSARSPPHTRRGSQVADSAQLCRQGDHATLHAWSTVGRQQL